MICTSAGTPLLPGPVLFPHTTVDWEQLNIFRWMPKTNTVCQGCPGLGDTTVAGPVSHWNFLTPLLGNWFWYTTVTRPHYPLWATQHCVVLTSFLARQICPGHMQNPVKSRGAHPRGCSRVLFLVEGPPFRAAAAALMGMVSLRYSQKVILLCNALLGVY